MVSGREIKEEAGALLERLEKLHSSAQLTHEEHSLMRALRIFLGKQVIAKDLERWIKWAKQ